MDITRVNNTVGHLIHAYAQAPWRKQRRWIGALLLTVLGLAMVAALYLDVTSHAAIAGREIQDLTNQMIAVQQENADLQSQLAEITSSDSMEKRAAALDYEPIDPNELEYVLVPGYAEPKPKILTSTLVLKPSAPSIPPEYTESLIAWLSRRMHSTASYTTGYSP